MAEKALTAPAYTGGGTERDEVKLPGDVFDGVVNMPVMHQAVKAYLANQRQGNAATKTRGFVVGGNQKPWRQKGTGRARQGSIRAPNWPGGGTVFGPSPRSYAQYVPRQVRALARKSALNARAREGSILVVDNFVFDAPRTARMVEILDSLGVTERKVLVLTDGVKPNVFMSCRNIPWAHVMPYSDASTYNVLWSDVVVIESGALGLALEPMAEKERTSARTAKVERPAAHARHVAEKKTAKKPAAKTKRPVAKKKSAAPKARKAAKGGAKKKGK